MTYDERLITARAMKAYGGGFVQALGEAFLRADSRNVEIIERGFPEYMREYGPGSFFFEAKAKEEA
jgi:hypothetical protein